MPVKGSAFYKYYYKANEFKPLISRNLDPADCNREDLYCAIKNKKVKITEEGIYIPLIFLNKSLGVMHVKTEERRVKAVESGDFQLDMELCSLIYYNSSIYSIAIKDELTRLYNIRYFNFQFNEIFDMFRNSHNKFSIIIMDIDHFKHYNDKYGHQAGDEILKMVALKISKTAGSQGVLARYGGEEFIILLPNFNSRQAGILGEKIRKKIEDLSIKNKDYFWRVTISLGVSTYPDHADNPSDLIRAADQALYQSKSLGRNRVSLYEHHGI